MDNKFSNGKIYKLIDNTNDNCYIGSTCLSLEHRLRQHIYDYKRYTNGNHYYVTSFDILENQDYKIILLEDAKVTNKHELEEREKYHILNEPRAVNKRKFMNISRDELLEIKRVRSKEYYNTVYREKKRRKINCQCGGKCTFGDISKHKKSIRHQKYENKIKFINKSYSIVEQIVDALKDDNIDNLKLLNNQLSVLIKNEQ
jgi:hypothetical protein